MSTYPVITAGMDPTSALFQSMLPVDGYKSGDQSVTGSVGAPFNDSALVVPVLANAVYEFGLEFFYTGGATGSSDLTGTWALPSGATMVYRWLIANTSNATQQGAATSASTQIQCGTNGATVQAASFKGTVTTSSTAGSLQFKWCQRTGSAVATAVKAGSLLTAKRKS